MLETVHSIRFMVDTGILLSNEFSLSLISNDIPLTGYSDLSSYQIFHQSSWPWYQAWHSPNYESYDEKQSLS